ncbi:MAG TPA: hypothetical protein VFT42_07535 [Solirubrobacteraceae bacterium]|nr:hypothetical protein [Solirubrobacteraceae bacterium]
MSRSTIRTAAALAATAALAGAPVAQARPAIEGPQLNYAQLRSIHGHVPPEPLGYVTSAPVKVAPVRATSPPAGGTSPVPWIAGGIAALLFAGIGLLRFSGVRAQRRRQPAA